MSGPLFKLRLLFALMGVAFAAWGVHIPSLKAAYGLSEGGVAWALLAVAAGAFATPFFAARVIARLGVPGLVRGAGTVLGLSLALLLPVGHPLLLGLLLVLMGASTALIDVALNAEASELETRTGRKLMSGIHAQFSLGGMVGALVAAGLLRGQVPAPLQLAGLGLGFVALAVWASRGLLPHVPASTPSSGYLRPRGRLALLGLLAVVALVAEGAMYDWSVLYLQRETQAAHALAALGYASFSAAMALTRLLGDRARERFRSAQLLTAGGLLASSAMALTLLLRDPTVALVGFALVGVGFALAVPLVMLEASRLPGVEPAQGIATVASIGYASMLIGPAAIGGIAEFSSLTWALSVVAVGAALLAVGARRL